MREIEITANLSGQRMDKFCMKVLPKASKSFFYKMFRKKNIVLNKKKVQGDERLKEGDLVTFFLSDDTFGKFSDHEEMRRVDASYALEKTRILYEDEQVIVYNKPTNILSQPNGKDPNLVEAAETYIMNRKELMEEGNRIGICNRLDRNTTGVTIIGKNTRALRLLNDAIARHQVDKEYRACVKGHIQKPIHLDGYQYKDTATNQVHMTEDVHKGVRIVTDISPIDYVEEEDITVVAVRLQTGKTHQIRHHLSSIRHPIIGDLKYGDQEVNRYFKKKYHLNHQLLHSYCYTFMGLEEPLAYLNHKAFVAPYDLDMKKFYRG